MLPSGLDVPENPLEESEKEASDKPLARAANALAGHSRSQASSAENPATVQTVVNRIIVPIASEITP